MCAFGALAELEAEAQNYRAPAYPTHKPEYHNPQYPTPAPYGKPAYPTPAPYGKPAYPTPVPYGKPAYPSYPSQPAYPSYEKYVSNYMWYLSDLAYKLKIMIDHKLLFFVRNTWQDYCDPKSAPKCAENSTLPWCLADSEYPTREIQVNSWTNTHK